MFLVLLLLSCSKFGLLNFGKSKMPFKHPYYGLRSRVDLEREGLELEKERLFSEQLAGIKKGSLEEVGPILSKLNLKDWNIAERVLEKCCIEKAKLVLERLAAPQSEEEKRKRARELLEVAIEHQDQSVTNYILDAHWRGVQPGEKHALLIRAIGQKKWWIVEKILEECDPCAHHTARYYGRDKARSSAVRLGYRGSVPRNASRRCERNLFCINDFISNDQDDLVERVWRISSKENKYSYLKGAQSTKERVVLFNRLASEGECWNALKEADIIIGDSAFLDAVIEQLFLDRSFLKEEIISTISVGSSLEREEDEVADSLAEELARKFWLKLYMEDRDIFLSVFPSETRLFEKSWNSGRRLKAICKLFWSLALEKNDVAVLRILSDGLKSKQNVINTYRETLKEQILQFEGTYSEELHSELLLLLEPSASFIIECLEKRKSNLIGALISFGQKEQVISAVEKEYELDYEERTLKFISDDVALFLLEHGIVSSFIFFKVCTLELETVKRFWNSGLLTSSDLSGAFDAALGARKHETCKYFVELGLNDAECLFKMKPTMADVLHFVEKGFRFREDQDYLLEFVKKMKASDRDFHDIFELIISKENFVREATNYAAAYLESHANVKIADLDPNFIIKLLGMSRANKSAALLPLLKHTFNCRARLRSSAYHRDAEEIYEGAEEAYGQLITSFVELGCEVDSVFPEISGSFSKYAKRNFEDSRKYKYLLKKSPLVDHGLGETSLIKILATSKCLQRLCFEHHLLDKAVQLKCLKLGEFLLERGAFVNQKVKEDAHFDIDWSLLGPFYIFPLERAEGKRLKTRRERREEKEAENPSPRLEGEWWSDDEGRHFEVDPVDYEMWLMESEMHRQRLESELDDDEMYDGENQWTYDRGIASRAMRSLLIKHGAAKFEGNLPGKKDLKELLLFNEVPDANLQATILSDPFNIMVLIEELAESMAKLGEPVNLSSVPQHFTILEPKYRGKSDFHAMRRVYEEMMDYVHGALKARIVYKMRGN